MRSALTTTIEVLQEKANALREEEQALQQERAKLNKREEEIADRRSFLMQAIEAVQSVRSSYDE